VCIDRAYNTRWYYIYFAKSRSDSLKKAFCAVWTLPLTESKEIEDACLQMIIPLAFYVENLCHRRHIESLSSIYINEGVVFS
jgi:hypothetical protein